MHRFVCNKLNRSAGQSYDCSAGTGRVKVVNKVNWGGWGGGGDVRMCVCFLCKNRKILNVMI